MKRTTIALLVLVSLGGGTALAGPAPALRVGSKAFAESVILGDAASLIAAAAGTPVEERRALGGTRLCWDALLSGALDLYPEYTGTLREEILKDEGPSGDLETLRATLAARGLGFIGPLGFDNRYALAMREAVAARLGVRAISDLAKHPELRVGLSNEFMRRRDGWPGLASRYALAAERAQGLDHELAIRGLAAGDLDVTDIYSTDAEIARDG
ncbi:MAG TPA: glycine betaine ABC transporter substrate-binding protein, partial [Polyangia bacterium]